jgi:hypothetical protein
MRGVRNDLKIDPMGFFTRILIGVCIMGAGCFLVIKTMRILDFFGPIPWAEEKLGGGGSYLLYKIVGVIICVIGIIVAANLWDAFLGATIGAILPSPDPAL